MTSWVGFFFHIKKIHKELISNGKWKKKLMNKKVAKSRNDDFFEN